MVSIHAWNLLSTGMGGIDWAGLPIVAALLGIDDPQTLIERLLVIRSHNTREVPDDSLGSAID